MHLFAGSGDAETLSETKSDYTSRRPLFTGVDFFAAVEFGRELVRIRRKEV